MLDKALGITYGQFLRAVFKGMVLYGLNRIANGKYMPSKTSATTRVRYENSQNSL